MANVSRLAAAFILGTAAAMLCAVAVLRRLPADPRDAMTAAGMLLMLAWPMLVIAAILPSRTRTGWALVAAVALIAGLAGWSVP